MSHQPRTLVVSGATFPGSAVGQPETNDYVQLQRNLRATGTTASRRQLPLRKAKMDDRLGPYNPMNGLYIRALVVVLLGSAATF